MTAPLVLRMLAAAACAVAMLAALGGCASTTAAGAVGAGGKQLLLISSQDMERIAAQSYAQLKAEAAADGTLNKDAELLRRVQAIAARLVPHTAVFRADAPAWQWEVNVVAGDQVNAFCMPGGKIVVYSGLAQQLDLSDEEIAVVLGHEIAHALREHSREQLSQALAARTAIGIGTAALGLGQGSAELARIGYQTLIASRFSRGDENEADRIGLELTARAGYDPRAGVSLWRKMLRADRGPQPPAFLSTHPSDERRIGTMESLLPVVMPLYESSRG